MTILCLAFYFSQRSGLRSDADGRRTAASIELARRYLVNDCLQPMSLAFE
jgi:hypothetical protein